MRPSPKLSRRVDQLHASPIREILSLIDRPGMISFAGGLPDPASFPSVSLAEMPSSWLQYGPSEGEPALREAVAREVTARGLACEAAQVLILSGSQQGIDLTGKLFVDAGTTVAVEAPTYLAALQVFRFLGARFAPFDAGALTEPLPDDTALVYAIPTFQNPSGRCYDARERAALAARCDAAGAVLFEDDPYRDLVYDDCERTPACAGLKRSSWIYQGSFSKVFAPGLRLGFLVASPDLMPYLTRLKQAADLHSSRLSQWLALSYLQDAGRAARETGLRASYRARRDAFAERLDRHLGAYADWTVPAGGLFFWLTLKRPADTRRLLARAIERGVAFMPGEAFYALEDGARPSLRLNFSFASEREMDSGLKTLADLLIEEYAETA